MSRSLLLCCALIAAAALRPLAAQPFTPVETDIERVVFGALTLGDYDRDGDLDVLTANHERTLLYRNPGHGDLKDWGDPVDLFPQLQRRLYVNPSVDVGDFDNDGALDLLIAGDPNETLLYRGDGGGRFSRVGATIPGALKSGMIDVVNEPASRWGDVDNDGDLDVLLVGYLSDKNGPPVSRIYRNDGDGRFAEVSVSLPATVTGPPAWGDFDNDGDLDLAAAAYVTPGQPSVRVFRNEGDARFTDVGDALLDAVPGALHWGDYDDDGDLDLLLAGHVQVTETVTSTGSSREFVMRPHLAIHRNDGGRFVPDEQILPAGVYYADWYDLNNDGDLDLLLNGATPGPSGHTPSIRIVENENGRFSRVAATLPRVWNGDLGVGDLDGDGDLDLLLTGLVDDGEESYGGTMLFRNDAPVANRVPEAPAGLLARFEGEDLVLEWTPAVDAETPSAGLSYNLRVGTTPGGSDVVSPHSLPDGTRMVPSGGNAGPGGRWVIRGIDPAKPHYWSVQAIDHALGASPFATEETTIAIRLAGEDEGAVPTTFGLLSSYPNPFNPSTTVRFALPGAAEVEVAVYDVAGRRVALLASGLHPAGTHEVAFDAAALPSGVYLCRLASEGRVDYRSLVLQK